MAKIQARIILEILGRPKEHVLSALNSLIERLGRENGVLILEKTVHEPVELKDSKDLYTTFSELTLQIDSIIQYFGVLFAYMPANIEVIYPENITLNNADFNDLSMRLAQRLHDYDAIAKSMIMEKTILENKLKESYMPQNSPIVNKKANQQNRKPAKKKSGKK